MRARFRSSGTLFLVAVAAALDGCMSRSSQPPAGSDRLTGREFLVGHRPEAPGFGLYSYILLEPLNSGNRDRIAAVLNAYLKLEETKTFVEHGISRSELNVTYLPLREAPSGGSSASVDWIVENYDFARAQIIARAAGIQGARGPYIVSYATPLTKPIYLDRERLLLQDLSGVPPELAFLWVREFVAQVRQPRYWDKRGLQSLLLSLRTQISVIAHAFAEVRSVEPDVDKLLNQKITLDVATR